MVSLDYDINVSKTKKFLFLPCLIFILACTDTTLKKKNLIENLAPKINSKAINHTSIVVLGTIQDAGSPQIGCEKSCCEGLFENPDHTRQIVSLGLVDAENNKTYLFEATPDIG